jgi:hypothetical protein
MFEALRDDPALAFSLSRVCLVLGALAGLAALWRRPRPNVAAGLLVLVHLAAWASYVAPLGRLYALGEHLDRSFNVGMAACAAAGNSPFQHVQVGHSSAEPFWNALVAAMALFRPEKVLAVYYWLSPLSMVIVSLGLYVGLRQAEGQDAWERVLIVSSVLGLSSLSAGQQSPVPPFWTGNFLLKPNHASAFAVVGVVLGMAGRRLAPWKIGLTLGLLSWVFVLTWAYVLPGLLVWWLLSPPGHGPVHDRRLLPAASRWRSAATALVVSALVAAPYAVFLIRDYGPRTKTDSATQMWRDPLAQALAQPHWATLDLGLLAVLAAIGIWVWRRRGSALDRVLLCLLAAVAGEWVAYEIGAPFGIAPEPDEFHYFMRFALALAAGAALAGAGRLLEAARSLTTGQGHLIVLMSCLPL